MIWEEEPLPAVAARLRGMGIEPVAFETCANAPACGDYLSAMKANAARFTAVLRKKLVLARGGRPMCVDEENTKGRERLL